MSTFNEIRAKIRLLETGLSHGHTPLANLELGILCQIIGEYNKAEEAFKRAITALPDNIYPRFLLLKLYDAKGEKDKVNTLAKELIQTDNSKMSLSLRLGIHRMLFGNSPKEGNILEVEEYEVATA